MKHQLVKLSQTATLGTLSDKCVGSLTPLTKHVTLKMLKTGPTIYSPYLENLERLTIGRSNITNVAHSPQLFNNHECWSRPGLEPSTSCTAVCGFIYSVLPHSVATKIRSVLINSHRFTAGSNF